MKRFDGTWTLQPYTQRGVDRLFGKQPQWNPFGSFRGARQGLQARLH